MKMLKRVEDSARETFPNGGEMGKRTRNEDWAKTPFGPIENWPQSLKTATGIMLESGFAMVVAWGPEFRFLYNDRYTPILGRKHPRALGKAAKDIFPEAWDNILEPLFMRTRGGETVAVDNLLIPLHRHGYLENCYFTIAYSPIRDETGGVGGMLAVVAETTERVEGERRMIILRDLAPSLAHAKTPADACAKASAILQENPTDVPFAFFYMLDAEGRQAQRVAAVGIPPGHAATPETIDIAKEPTQRDYWPLAEVLQSGKTNVVDDLVCRFGHLPCGPFPEPVHTAVILPLTRPGLTRPNGFLIAGVSPRRTLNDRYRDFFERAAEHVTIAIANAGAFEEERPAGAINVFQDITVRKRREQDAALLVALSQEIALLTDEKEIIAVTIRAIGKHIGAQRCYFIETDDTGMRVTVTQDWRRDDVSSLRGIYDMENYGGPECWKAFSTRTVAITDIDAHPQTRDFRADYEALDIRAYATAPFFHGGRWVVSLAATEAIPREWTPDELALLENAVARVGPLVERARVAVKLRESEERFRMIADNMSALAWTADRLGFVTWYNRRWFDYTGTTFEEMQERGWERVYHPDHLLRVKESLRVRLQSGAPWEDTFPLRGKDGKYRWFHARAVPVRDDAGNIVRWFGSNTDINELREAQEALQHHSRMLEGLNRAGAALAAENDLEKIVQRVTDVGREISGAAYGAFFSNLKNVSGESYILSTFSGVPRETFPAFPTSRNSGIFDPTFQGEGALRTGDVRRDRRFGKSTPSHGTPKGQLELRSYLGVPVKSRSGNVLGGLFYGHPDANVFTAEAERGVVALAAQAAHAIDNATLHTALQKQLDRAKQDDLIHRRLAFIVLSSDDAIIGKDLNGIITSWNPGAERIFGYGADEMVGKPILTLIPAHLQHEEVEILDSIKRGERVDHFETIRRAKDGRLVDVSITVSPVKSDTGEILGASKIARDISDRRRAEAQQRALYEVVSRVNRAEALPEFYAAAIDAILVCQTADRAAILLRDAEGVARFVEWRGLSEEYRRTVEGHSPWRPEDADPQPVCIDDVNTADLEPHVREAIKREGIRALAFVPIIYDKRLLGKFMICFNTARSFTVVELRAALTIASQVAFAIERRKTAEGLGVLVDERTASLRKAIEQMEEFSYSVSHDLQSPVRAMRGYAEAVLFDYGSRLDDEGRELLGRIERNGTRMDRLIQDLLTYSRLAQREICMEPVSLDGLVRAVIQLYPEMSPELVAIEISGPLPEVLGHEPSLTQVVSNLLSNAVKFVSPGTRPHVRVSCERTPGGVRLWFQDNGIGINPEYRQRLFGMFERVQSSQKFEGTGIGLAIVRKAMERMNGTVGMESDGHSGSRFWIELPAAART